MTEPLRPEQRINETNIGGEDGGFIESVKEAVVFALREAITGTMIEDIGQQVQVMMEYPAKIEDYPNIWVQFSFTKLRRAGVGHEAYMDGPNGELWPIQEFMFEGRTTLTAMALKNAERDRISDKIIKTIAFSRPIPSVILDPNRNTNQLRQFWDNLVRNPFVSIAVNTDEIYAGGQAVSVGTALAAPNSPVYEDTYSFDMRGEFNLVFRNDGNYFLTRVDQIPSPVNEAQVQRSTRWDQNGFLINPEIQPETDADNGWV